MSPYKNDVWGLIHEIYICSKHLLMLQSQKKTSEITEFFKNYYFFVFKSPKPRPPNLSVTEKKLQGRLRQLLWDSLSLTAI